MYLKSVISDDLEEEVSEIYLWFNHVLFKTYEVCQEKVQPLLIQQEWFAQHWCNLAAKESGLECTCVNNDDFAVLVSGGSRYHWVNMCTVWLSHSKWLSEYSKESALNFGLSLNIPLWKPFTWFRRPRPGQVVIGSFIMTMHLLMHQVLCRVFWWNIKSPRWLSFPTAQIRHPVTSGFSQN